MSALLVGLGAIQVWGWAIMLGADGNLAGLLATFAGAGVLWLCPYDQPRDSKISASAEAH